MGRLDVYVPCDANKLILYIMHNFWNKRRFVHGFICFVVGCDVLWVRIFLPRDATHKHGLFSHAVSV